MSSKTAPTEFEKRASGTMDLILEELRGVKLELQKQGEKLEKQGEKIEEQGEAMRELREARPSKASAWLAGGMKSSFNRRPTEAFDFDQSDDSEHSRLGTPKGKRGLAAGFKAASKGGHGRGRGRGQAKARGGARPKAAQDWPKQEEAPSSRVTRSTRKQDGADAGREAPPSGPVRLGPGSPALKPAEEEALVLFRRKWNFHLELTGKHLVVRVRTQTSGRESGKVSVTPLYDIGVTVSHGTIDLWTRWFFEGPDNDDVAPLAWLCADGVPPPELGARSIPSQIAEVALQYRRAEEGGFLEWMDALKTSCTCNGEKTAYAFDTVLKWIRSHPPVPHYEPSPKPDLQEASRASTTSSATRKRKPDAVVKRTGAKKAKVEPSTSKAEASDGSELDDGARSDGSVYKPNDDGKVKRKSTGKGPSRRGGKGGRRL